MHASLAVWEEQSRSAFQLPECAQSLVVVDVSRTQSSNHRSARIPPCIGKKNVNEMKSSPLTTQTHSDRDVSVCTQVLSQQPSQH